MSENVNAEQGVSAHWQTFSKAGLPKKKEKKLRKSASKTWQKRTSILYLTAEILYPKAENTNVQMELKPLWFGLFLILIETWEQ